MSTKHERISFKDVELAFRKLKSYIYHDNFSLPIRIALAEYESEGIHENLLNLWKELNTKEINKMLSKEINKIDFYLLPKSFDKDDCFNEDDGYYYSNKTKKNIYKVTRVTSFIDCHINIHIFTVLWLMKIGRFLDEELIPNCHGNRLERNEENKVKNHSIKLFYPYYRRYNSWRDEAIKKAKSIHHESQETAILNLDIKDFYHSVDIAVTEITIHNPEYSPDYDWMQGVLERIHSKYRRLLGSKSIVEKSHRRYLPIGLVSSQVLANYYLCEFDKIVLKNIKPIYYGRYVDDILIVFCNPSNSTSNTNEFILKNLCKKSLWKGSNTQLKKSKEGFELLISSNSLSFQLSKVKLYHFSPEDSINLLDEFEKEIRKNSSEFRWQPDDDEIFNSFESSSFRIQYNDTINKLRSIEAFNSNKLGASTHLSKLIKISIMINHYPHNELESTNTILKAYFQGQRGLELSQLWEKTFSFYVINESEKELIEFARGQIESLLKIKFFNKFSREIVAISESLQNSLFQILAFSFTMAASLNRTFFNEKIFYELNNQKYTIKSNRILQFLTLTFIKKYSNYIVDSNLLRHHYLNYPLLNYCKQNENFSFTSRRIVKETNYKIDQSKIKYSPRFIHFHELSIFYFIKKNIVDLLESETEYINNEGEFLWGKYSHFNKLDHSYKKEKKHFPILKTEGIKNITIPETKSKSLLKIGLVNEKVFIENSIKSITNQPNLSLDRYLTLNHILNEAIKTKCDLIIFPEISIPFRWITKLCNISKDYNIAIICGLEHFSSRKKVYNYVATILPFNMKSYHNCYADFRLKKDYSPEEINEILNRKYVLPIREMRSEKLRLYSWYNTYFSVLNCFELSDIYKRNLFCGKVDFMTTIEYNRDVPYFSSISESLARDIHAYIVQVNTSHYGDSRITQPASTSIKDIVKIKGGEDSLLITGIINIDKLREFQRLNYNGQKEFERKNEVFKQTPANFTPAPSRNK